MSPKEKFYRTTGCRNSLESIFLDCCSRVFSPMTLFYSHTKSHVAGLGRYVSFKVLCLSVWILLLCVLLYTSFWLCSMIRGECLHMYIFVYCFRIFKATFCVFGAQDGLQFPKWLKMTLNFWHSCLHSQATIASWCHHPGLWGLNLGLCVCKASTLQSSPDLRRSF